MGGKVRRTTTGPLSVGTVSFRGKPSWGRTFGGESQRVSGGRSGLVFYRSDAHPGGGLGPRGNSLLPLLPSLHSMVLPDSIIHEEGHVLTRSSQLSDGALAYLLKCVMIAVLPDIIYIYIV